MIDFVVGRVEEHVDLGGSRFSESILERWYSAHASQQNVVTLEFGSPCPRSFTIIFSSTQVVMINNGSLRSLTKCFISNVEHFAFMNRTYWRTIWHISCVCFSNGSPRSLMCLLNVGIFTVFRWTCLDYTRFNNGSAPYLSEETGLFVKRIYIDFLRTIHFSSILHGTRESSELRVCPDLSRLGLGIGWFDWKLLDCCPTSGRWACSEPNSLFQSCLKEIFGGSRRDMYTFSYDDFSSFHPNNFRNTISWKCFLKDDCVRSSLIEFQSCLNSKIDVDPIYCVLMSLPCFMHDVVHSSRSHQDPCDLCP